MVRSAHFQGENRGSIPLGATMLFEVACISIVATHFFTPPKMLYTGHIARQLDEMAKKDSIENEWKKRTGEKISISSMDDNYLANSIRMMARKLIETNYQRAFNTIVPYDALSSEARKRGFKITILKEGYTLKGRKEYAEVLIPSPDSKLLAGFLPGDWESRPQEE